MMRAGVLWMVMVCLSDGAVSGYSVGTITTVSKLSKVFVSCPSIMADSLNFKYLLSFNGITISLKDVNMQTGFGENLFSGRFEVTANNSGVYTCKREVIYPPPFREDYHTTEVIVAEKQYINDTVAATSQSCPVTSPVIPEVVMWVACGALLVYSLSITCVTVVICMKRKTDEDDTVVYSNTRHGEHRKPYKV